MKWESEKKEFGRGGKQKFSFLCDNFLFQPYWELIFSLLRGKTREKQGHKE
jgi:hypothetical protein